MKKRITSIIISACMFLSMLPQVMAGSLVTTYQSFDYFDAGKAYDPYFTGRVNMGHYYSTTAHGGVANNYSLGIQVNDTATPLAFSLADTNKTVINPNSVDDDIVVYSIDTFQNTKLDSYYMGDTAGNNVLGCVIDNSIFEYDTWGNLTVVYVRNDDGSVTTYTFYNGELVGSKVNESGVDALRYYAYGAVAKSYWYIDNVTAYSLDSFDAPSVSSEHLDNGELIGYYNKTAGEMLSELAVSGVTLEFVDSKGDAVAEDAYLFEDMKLVATSTANGKEYKANINLKKNQSYVDFAIEQVNLPEVVEDSFELPTEFLNTTVTWESSVPGIISTTGEVVRPPASDVVVVMTATYEDMHIKKTVEYNVLVKSLGQETSVSYVNVILPSKNLTLGEVATYDVKQVDDFGSWDLRYSVTCDSEYVIIDEDAREITASKPGVYKVKFTCLDRDYEKVELIAFGNPGSYVIFDSEELYSENFDSDEYDVNPLPTSGQVKAYNGSNALYAAQAGQNQSQAFGPVDDNGKLIPLSDYTFEADLFIEKGAGSATENFTVRMRDTDDHPVTRDGYNFSYMEFAFLSESNPTEIGVAQTGDYEKINSVFALSRGKGGTAHTWRLGNTKAVPQVHDFVNKCFNKASYHIKYSIIEDSMVGVVYDGDEIISTQVCDLALLDGYEERIESGYTRIITDSTSGYLDNIVISRPLRWINDIKIELSDATITDPSETIEYEVLGKSTNGEWIELPESDYTLVVSSSDVSASDGVIEISEYGDYTVAVYAGELFCVENLSLDELNDEKDAMLAELVIDSSDAIMADFELPEIDDATISWVSSNPAYITIDGNTAVVTRPVAGESDVTVSLTATVYGDGISVQKTITVTVLADVDDQMAIKEAIDAISIPTKTTSDITLPTEFGDEGVTIEWKSLNSKVISDEGDVTQPKKTAKVTLVATYRRGDTVKEISYTVSVAGTESGGGGGGGGGGSSTSDAPKPQIPAPSNGNDTVYVNPGEPIGDTEPKAPVAEKPVFADVALDAWYASSVKTLYYKGIINGVSETEFEPMRNVTREEFIKILCEAAGIEGAPCSAFTDVPGGSWYEEYVGGALSAGIVSGISDDLFGTGLNISRQDMSVMIYNVLKANGITAEASDEVFADDAVIKDYAKEGVYALRALGIVDGRGDNEFAPQGNATRAEAAVIILRMMNKITH